MVAIKRTPGRAILRVDGVEWDLLPWTLTDIGGAVFMSKPEVTNLVKNSSCTIACILRNGVMSAMYHVGRQSLYLQFWFKTKNGFEQLYISKLRIMLLLYNANLFAFIYDCKIELHT